MEGLEAKEIYYSQLKIDNEKFRIDDLFFLNKYLKAYDLIRAVPHYKFSDIIKVLTDFHANGSYENIAQNFTLLDHKDYAYMIRSTDLESRNFADGVKYIDQRSYEFLTKTKLYGGELLINKIGSPGRVYLMPNLNRKSSLGMNLFLIRSNISSGFLWSYFNTSIGQTIIQRKVNGTVPLTIDKEAIRTLYIPQFSNDFYNQIDILINRANISEENFKQKYAQCENLLLDTVGLSNYKSSDNAENIKSLKESFMNSGRLDAEYYQPKYEDLFKKITSQKYKLLGDLVNIKKSIEPGSSAYQEEGIPFVRVSNLSKFGISQPEIHLDRKEFKNTIKPKKDIILLSKDGSVGIAYKAQENLDCITSGAILHLEVKDKEVLPDYLTLVLNSLVVKLQAERDAGGSIIQHWKPSEIQEVIIPIINKEIQQQIAELTQESFTLKAESEKLLETAKRAVEIAIEESEENAIEFINENN